MGLAGGQSFLQFVHRDQFAGKQRLLHRTDGFRQV